MRHNLSVLNSIMLYCYYIIIHVGWVTSRSILEGIRDDRLYTYCNINIANWI